MPIASQALSTKKNNPPYKAPTIIAIGGAKGGIGKSVFCANLGVFLAGEKHRTILMDLDLGGANLHLFMGMWNLEHTLQDYLDKKNDSIEEILVATPHGPLLAGGGGGKLGSAHIPFVRKLKLFKALRAIDADYIILDLGGDTTFNSLDYFLAADTRIVLTTCDPASYLDAYNFIKMALYRKLTRIFGPESPSDYPRNPAFLASVEKFVKAGLSGSGRRIDALLEDTWKHHRSYFPMLKDLLNRFGPYLVVNMADNMLDTKQLAERLKKVSHRMLSINLDYIGSIARNEGIKQCTLDLVPHVIRHPRGILAYFFNQIRFIL